jgi:hypothetical protein
MPPSMNELTVSDSSVQTVLAQLLGCLRQLDTLGAELAASHLDAAIHAFAEQFELDRITSETE